MPTTPPLSQFTGTNTTPTGAITTNPNQVALLGVDPNQLTSYQLGQLQRSSNPLVRVASDNAMGFAAARGAGLSGAQYGDAATRAAFDSMTPIAQADAGVYDATAHSNQDALNQQNIERMGNNTSVHVAGIGAAAQRYSSDNSLRAQQANLAEQQRQFDVQQGNRTQDREWQVADQNTAARASQRSQLFNTMINTVFSDPSYWRDPEAAMGLFNTYGSNMDDLMQSLFPEYWDTAETSP